MEIDTMCPKCGTRNTFEAPGKEQQAPCSQCKAPLFEYASDSYWEEQTLDQCPVCDAEHVYRQRDFNRKLGIGLVVIGAILAPFTYGISLIVLALVDFIIFRSVGEIVCCYQCGAIFRELPTVKQVEPFNLSLYDYYRNLKTSAT